MGRQPCCDKYGLKRGPWTIEEDHKLMSFILSNGIQCWRMVPKLAGLLRCGKSCRLRWINYLRPDLKRGALSEMEEDQIIELHARLGNRWSKIASHFPGRTDNEIKNHWNTRIKKRLRLQGVDPLTHQAIGPKDDVEEKTESDMESDLQNIQELATDSILVQGNAKITQGSSKAKYESETSNVINNYDELMSRNIDMDLWTMSQNVINPNSSCYSCPSLEESVSYANSAVSFHEESSMLQNWVESVDSVMSWDVFNQLDQQFLASFQQEGRNC